MEYKERLLIQSIKYPFMNDNMDTIIRILVNKYKYLLNTIIESIHTYEDLDNIQYEPIYDIVQKILLNSLFPYIKDIYCEISRKKFLKTHFNKYIDIISIDLFNKKKDISCKNITFNEHELIHTFKKIFSMYENYWDIPIKYFLKSNGRLLGKLSIYTYDYNWNNNNSNNVNLNNKINKSYNKLIKNFSSFFAFDEYIDNDNISYSLSQFIYNYTKCYSLYSELSNYIFTDDIIMIIIFKANIFDD